MSQSDYAASKELARANREFYRAFEAFDSEAMRALWLVAVSTRPDISVIEGVNVLPLSCARLHGSAPEEGVNVLSLPLVPPFTVH